MGLKLDNKKVLIIGLGRSGVAAAQLAVQRGAKVMVSEMREVEQVTEETKKLAGLPIEFSFGRNDISIMLNVDLIVVSPGVPLSLHGLKAAKEKGIPIISELELAVREIKKPIVAVTGTNGKTTTTALLGHLLAASGLKVCVGGNIGAALSGLVNEANQADWVVVEISSFQLETTPSLSPDIAVMLNVTPDHLDRHESFEEYLKLKLRLFAYLKDSGYGIYNAGDKQLKKKVKRINKQLIPFDTKADFKEGFLWSRIPEREPQCWSLAGVPLQGKHNRENILAAVIAAELCGARTADIQASLATFKGLAHRMELICEDDGVRYYDDSKGTNVGATVAALENFKRRVILIAGGQDKGTDFQPLQPLLKKRVKKMILLGEAKDKMASELGSFTDTILTENMEEAVNVAHEVAVSGDVVLLSPACASFDMFRDYAERGDVFKREVGKILGKVDVIARSESSEAIS